MLFTPWFTSLPFQHSDPNSGQAQPTGSRARQTWANWKCSSAMFMWLDVVSRGFWFGTSPAFCTVHGISRKATCWIKELPNGTSGPVAWPWLQQNREGGWDSKCVFVWVWNIQYYQYKYQTATMGAIKWEGHKCKQKWFYENSSIPNCKQKYCMITGWHHNKQPDNVSSVTGSSIEMTTQ